MSASEPWRNVGHRIRSLRKTHGLTINQLANGCGLSPNAISLVERGQVAPTVITLCKIASALGVSASSFLQDVCPNEVILVRAEERPVARPARELGRFLSFETSGADGLASGRLHFSAPGSACSAQPQACTTAALYCQQMVMCLCGTIEYEDSEGQTYLLAPGDQLTCNGYSPHRWRSTSDQTAIAVLVMPGADEHSEN